MKIKGVFFDLDGVLIDAKEWHYEALNKALGLLGFEISRYDHLKTYDGLPTRKKLEMLSVEKDLPVSLHDFINEIKQQYVKEMILEKCRPVFRHELALAKLKHEGYLMAVCTNSIRESLELMLRKSNLSQYFDLALSWEDCGNPKPSPEIYEKAMEKLGVSPRETLVLEDNDHGIKAARDSGANLLIIKDVQEVNYDNIMAKIKNCEEELL